MTGEMIAAGPTDQAIADRIGGVNRMAVSRHPHNHVMAPAKALAGAAGKGRDAADQRAQVMAAAKASDPAAFVALAGTRRTSAYLPLCCGGRLQRGLE